MTGRLAWVWLLLPLLAACCARPCARPARPCGEAVQPPAAETGADGERAILWAHAVNDLVLEEPARMDRLLEKARVWGSWPGGSVTARGLGAIMVKAPPRVQDLVEELLRRERAPTLLRYFDVQDVLPAHPGLEGELRPMLTGVEGELLAIKNGTLIARAPPEVLDAIGARLDAMRAAK